jgi:hypothetical protein
VCSIPSGGRQKRRIFIQLLPGAHWGSELPRRARAAGQRQAARALLPLLWGLRPTALRNFVENWRTRRSTSTSKFKTTRGSQAGPMYPPQELMIATFAEAPRAVLSLIARILCEFRRTSGNPRRYAPAGHLLRGVWPSTMYNDHVL